MSIGIVIAAISAGLVLAALVVGGKAAPIGTAEHRLGQDGWVEADPRGLAEGAGVNLEVYALASMMTSEAGSHEMTMIAVGWAAKNRAATRGESIFRTLTRAGKNNARGLFVAHESSGLFAPQNVGPRYASTRKPPTARALELARQIIDDEIADVTDGCTQFDAPTAQDALLACATKGYTKTAAQIAEERSRGADLVMLPGVSQTRFWRPRA